MGAAASTMVGTGPAGTTVVPPPPVAGDRYERLRQIGELRASGVLSESEFEEEKARILKES